MQKVIIRVTCDKQMLSDILSPEFAEEHADKQYEALIGGGGAQIDGVSHTFPTGSFTVLRIIPENEQLA